MVSSPQLHRFLLLYCDDDVWVWLVSSLGDTAIAYLKLERYPPSERRDIDRLPNDINRLPNGGDRLPNGIDRSRCV